MPAANRALWRAAHSLTHPAIVAAVIGLLLNDHWLRHHYPSWLTGKLGDFTWLIFAPLIAALFFALVIPRRIEHHTRIVGWLSFASVGLWFAAAKTIPIAHALTATAWSALVGWQGSLRLDPTDLLTLPGLLIGAWVWSRADDSPLNLRPLAYVIAALGLVGTLASDEPYYSWVDRGVTCLFQRGDSLVTVGPLEGVYEFTGGMNGEGEYVLEQWWDEYTSLDGGLTWHSERIDDDPELYPDCEPTAALTDPANPMIQYRWQPEETIEQSVDGGRTWILAYDLAVLRQTVRISYNHGKSGYAPSPLTGIVDATTGNLVLAMSLDGVLVRPPGGTWQWVAVGGYQLADLHNVRKLEGVLFFHWWLVGALFFLIITTAVAYMRQRLIGSVRRGMLFAGWIGWGIVWLGFNYCHLDTYEQLASPSAGMILIISGLLSLALLLVIAIPLSVNAVMDLMRYHVRQSGHVLLSSFSLSLLYLLPLVLWARGTIPRYLTALVFSLILTLAGLFATYKYLTRVLPVLPRRVKIIRISAAGDSDEVDGG